MACRWIASKGVPVRLAWPPSTASLDTASNAGTRHRHGSIFDSRESCVHWKDYDVTNPPLLVDLGGSAIANWRSNTHPTGTGL